MAVARGRSAPRAPAQNHLRKELRVETEELQEQATISATQGLSSLVVALLKGVVYQETHPALWGMLLDVQAQVRDYIAVLGLELVLDEAEGYAYLRARPESEEDEAEKRPRLVARRPLSFPVSLLIALLRKKLAEFDAGGGGTRLMLSRDEIGDIIRVFLPQGSNETRLMDQVDAHINKVVDMGFLRPLRGQQKQFEVRRILKAYVDAQ
ncbi:MAG: DUF4194 domain-containing protein, partial [Candidatus Hydrogenedentes bacterium]|nr:DUF4194 domain-containing protein [Candidatus Hydrogenedentota bacterium]